MEKIMEAILQFTVECPYWCSFKRQGVNFAETYPLPPHTTLYGMVANALGMEQDDYSLQSELKFSVSLLESLDVIESRVVEDYSRIMKISRSDAKSEFEKNSVYSHTNIIRQRILSPKYEIYLKGNHDRIKHIKTKIENPERPLYLGESDDVVILTSIELLLENSDYQITETQQIDSIAEGVFIGGRIIQIPYQFVKHRDFALKQKIFTCGVKLSSSKPVHAYRIISNSKFIVFPND